MFIDGIHSTYDASYYVRQKAFYQHSETENQKRAHKTSSTETEAQKTKAATKFDADINSLSEDEKKKLDQLKKRDQEIRDHELAHQRAAGAIGSPPQYKVQLGPDGKQYATGGSVKLNTSKGRTPEETLAKAQQIQRAALAPKNPSTKDRQVAQEAAKMETNARAEIMQKRQAGLKAYTQTIASMTPEKTVKADQIQIQDSSQNANSENTPDFSNPEHVSFISELDSTQSNFHQSVNLLA